MNTPKLRWLSRAGFLTISLLVAGCDEEEARRVVAARQAAAGAPAATPVTHANATPPVAGSTNAPVVVEKLPPARIPLPEAVDEVVTMAEAGVAEAVLLAYVEKTTATFDMGVEEILYLNDLGIPGNVVAALVRKSGPAAEKALAAIDDGTAALAGTPVPAVTNEVAAVQPPPAATAAALTPAPAPTAELVSTVQSQPAPPPVQEVVGVQTPVVNNYYYFQQSLSPYGSWVEIAPYGMCWQPTVARIDTSWRPYCDRGRWIWTDSGWYWQSDYSWGWAAFHYGRWHHHPHRGWLWMPDTVWGPAWVSWRRSEAYCGWAPLPPDAHFALGVGFSHRGSRVGMSFDFGLSFDHYVFVGYDRFHDRHPYRYRLPAGRQQAVYKESTVINNYIVGNNNTIINEGVSRDRITAVTRQEIRKVSLQEVSATPGKAVRSDRLASDGSTLAVYRPTFSQRTVAPVLPPGGPSRREGVKPPPADQRTVWTGGNQERALAPIRPRGSGPTGAAPAPAPAPGVVAAPGKSPAGGRVESRPDATKGNVQRQATPVAPLEPRSARTKPALSPKETENRASGGKPLPVPSTPPRVVALPTPTARPVPVPAPTAPQVVPRRTPAVNPAPAPKESAPVGTKPGNTVRRQENPSVPSKNPTPQLTPSVSRPVPNPASGAGLGSPGARTFSPQTRPTPSITSTPGSLTEPRLPQAIPSPAPLPTIVTRPPAPRYEPPKYQPAPSVSQRSFSVPSAPAPTAPSFRSEPRSSGISSQPAFRPPAQSVAPSPAPSRSAPSVSAPPPSGRTLPSQSSRSSGGGGRGRENDR